MNTLSKAKLLISRFSISKDIDIEAAKLEFSSNEDEWSRITEKAYSLWLQSARKMRDEDINKPHVSATSNDKIQEILRLNESLCDFALCMPTISTASDVTLLKDILVEMPRTEKLLLRLIEHLTLSPNIRASQNIGRIKEFSAFKPFSQLVESATICYYRGNYASSYLTLVPVIEGVILRWSGYSGHGDKLEFEAIRNFFKRSYRRQPCPGNPLFHEVFSKACDRIISDHLYKHSKSGTAYSEFNRHQAAHLLRDTDFATRENCIRLFLLLDTMSELYLYEKKCEDSRFYLERSQYEREMNLYKKLQLEHSNGTSAESILLATNLA